MNATMRSASNTATLVGLIFAVSMTTIDQTIVALSAPTIQRELGLTQGAIEWAINAYLLAAAGLFVVCGRLSDMYGHRRLALIGTAGFAATSVLCAMAPSGGAAGAWLIAARALQGASAALLVPAAVGIVVQSFEVARRGRAMAVFFAITGAMTALGPIAGGYLTEWTWRSIFWVNVPIAAVGFTIVAMSAAPSTRVPGRLDILGGILISGALTLVVLGLQESADWGWGSLAVWLVLAGGTATIVAFTRYEVHARDPIVRVSAFRDRGFSLAILSTLVASTAFVPTFFFLSVYGQVSLQQTALTTGLLFLKFFLGFVIASRFGSAMFDASGAKRVLLVGGVLGTIGYGLLAFQIPDLRFDSAAFLNVQTPAIMLAGAGIGFMYSPMSTDAVNRAIGASYGEVTALSQSARSFGGALGLALLGPLVTSGFTIHLARSLQSLGIPATVARHVAQTASSSHGTVHGSTQLLRPEVANRVRDALAQDYAAAVRIAFLGMAIALSVLVAMSVAYPTSDSQPASVGSDESARTIVEEEARQ